MPTPSPLSRAALLGAPLCGATVAFDLDGTLVDTAPDLGAALNVVLRESALPPTPLPTVRHLVGQGARALIQRGFALNDRPLPPEDLDRLTARFVEAYRADIAAASRPFPGVEAALDALAAAGATLVVCTNKRTDLSVALLDALGLAPRFAAIVGADLAPAPKPDPRCFTFAVEAGGGDPARALMVGDTDNDILAAKRASAPAIAVDFGYSATPAQDLGADAVISRFEDLPEVAVRLLARG